MNVCFCRVQAEKDQELFISRDNERIKANFEMFMNQGDVTRLRTEREPKWARRPGGRPSPLGGRPGVKAFRVGVKAVSPTDLEDQ